MLKIQIIDGTWQQLIDDWAAQCRMYGEDFETYAIATMPVLENLAANPERNAGVYAVERDDHIGAVCQLNRTALPGYEAPVLRVRLLTVSPRYDFGDISISDYGDLLVATLTGVIGMSFDLAFEARHINFHLRSPSDRPFFQALGTGLDRTDVFHAVKMAGSWLYITKK